MFYLGFLTFFSCGTLRWLLSDTEVREDVIEQIVGIDLAGDGAQMMQGLAHVRCDQVSGYV